VAGGRTRIPRDIEAAVVMRVRRRCCLCWYLNGHKDERRGQIAHLNRKRDDHRLAILVFLCLDHHDEYDGKTSQSKNFTEAEVRAYREQLIVELGTAPLDAAEVATHETPDPASVTAPSKPLWRPWRFPAYQIADQPEFFAYTANGSDGVCQIERIHLPDGRIVIVCVDIAGNPGTSITNAAEEIADQVCARFGIAPDRLLWLEHYADAEPEDWRLVTFTYDAEKGFIDPVWVEMTPARWRTLKLSPCTPAPKDGYRLATRIKKHFPWPPADGSTLFTIRDEEGEG
jgi:hypothetical protein